MKSVVISKVCSVNKSIILCLLSAVLLVFSFPDFNFWLCAWFGFVPLFFAIQGKSKLKAFLFSYLTGFLFWSGIIYWLIHVTLPGTIILILYLSLYFAFFGLIFNVYALRLTPYCLIFLSCSWVILEYIRSYLFSGFPWALLGYSQYNNPAIIQVADITGAWGVSFLIILVNLFLYAFFRRDGAKKKSIVIIPLILIFLFLVYGYHKLSIFENPHENRLIKITVVQGNIPQELKWDVAASDYILEKYLVLSGEAAKDNPDLIVWPEASLPVIAGEGPDYFLVSTINFAQRLGIPFLIGVVRKEGELYYNSAILISPQEASLQIYDKLHLVPFGEYIPLRKVFRFLETIAPIGDIERGKDITLFNIKSSSTPEEKSVFSVLICFEDLFPELSRSFVNRGCEFLINITNDAWYKKTSAAQQHFQASVFRAVENRVSLVRAANTGVSGFINPAGKVSSLVQDSDNRKIFVSGVLTQTLFFGPQEKTFYTRFGEFFIYLLLIFILYGIFFKLCHSETSRKQK